MNLKGAMQLGGQCLLAWLDPEKEFMPTGSVGGSADYLDILHACATMFHNGARVSTADVI